MEEYEIDYEQSCPKCGNGYTHFRTCDNFNCDDGFADEHFDDPLNSPEEGEDLYTCPDCKGRGIIQWCPKCGYDLLPNDLDNGSDEQT